MKAVEIIAGARATLNEALAADWPALSLSDVAKAWLLGQVWGESRFGSSPDWGTSNNWGAVTYHLGNGKFLEHADHDVNGKPVVYRFQAYDTQLAAACDWLRVLFRGAVPTALQGGTVRDLSAAMYANHYYTGVAGSAAARIDAYASLIANGAAFIEEEIAVTDLGLDISTTAGVQEALSRLGFDPGPVDGAMGPNTRCAVVAFQTERGLVADGIAGPVTKSALLAALEQSSLRLQTMRDADTIRDIAALAAGDGGTEP